MLRLFSLGSSGGGLHVSTWNDFLTTTYQQGKGFTLLSTSSLLKQHRLFRCGSDSSRNIYKPFLTQLGRRRFSMIHADGDKGATEQPVLIIGAGVNGLTTALTVQKRHPNLGAKITIVASEFPSLPKFWTSSNSSIAPSNQVPRPSADYASMWAGAHYRPIPRSTRQLEDEFELAVKTSDVMKAIAEEYGEDMCGVAVMPAVELLEKVPEGMENVVSRMKSGDVYAGVGDGFKVLNKEELKAYDTHGKLTWGCEYVSYCVNVHLFCCWLLERFVEAGGRVIHKRLDRLEDAFEIAEGCDSDSSERSAKVVSKIVINTSGRNFDTDPKTKIIRGQTVLVRNEYSRTITRQMSDGGWCFLIPRPGGGGTVVGGTKEIGDVEIEPRPETRKLLLENAAICFPDFVKSVDEFDVVMDNVGRRPWREGGLRIEVEDMSSSADERHTVLHGYGAGGRGYELSWGVAERIVDMLDGRFESVEV